MVSLDDFEQLARYQAGELSADEAKVLEAELGVSTELKQALRQLEQLESLSADLPRASLSAPEVEALVARALPRRHRAWFAAAAMLLLVGAGWLWCPSSDGRLEVVMGQVTLDARAAHVGDSVHSGAIVVTGEDGLASIDRGVIIATASDVRVLGDRIELRDGAVVARGEQVRVALDARTFIVNGEALISREPFEDTFRETSHLTVERLVNSKRMALGGVALVGGAVALYVLSGTVTIEHPEAAAELVHAPRLWLANGELKSSMSFAAVGETALSADGGLAQSFDGLLELHVMARGQPVGGAKVKLYERGQEYRALGKLQWRERANVAETNDAGIVLLGANPGAYVASVRSLGYPPTLHEFQRPTAESKTVVTIVLEPGTALTGVTQDGRTQQPVAPAAISVRPWLRPDVEEVTTAADARGAFSFESLSPGSYVVEGVSPGGGKASKVVRLPLSEPVKLVFRGSGFVEGFVKLEDGGVSAGAKVMLVGEDTVETESSPTGSFSLEVPPGSWHAQAYSGELVGSAAGEVRVHTGETSQPVTIILQSTSLLTGLVLSGDAGVERAVVTVSPHNGAGELARAETSEAGRYRIPLPPGVYDVDVVSTDDARASERGVDVGRKETKLDFQLPRAGIIRGKIVDEEGKPFGDVLVEAYPNWQRTLKRTTLAVGGQFEFQNVSPGLSTVMTKPGARAVGVAKLVKVEPGAVAEVELVVAASAILEGKVNWKCSGPPQALSVYAYATNQSLGGTAGGRQPMPVGEPTFRMELPPASYTVVVNNEDDSCSGSASVTVDAKRATPLTINVVKNQLYFSVTVKESDGHPAANALVSLASSNNPMAMVLQTNEDGVLEVRDFGSPDDGIKLLKASASKDGRVGHSGPLSPSTKVVTITLGAGQRLDVKIEGAPEGSVSKIELVLVPDFVFTESLVTSNDSVTLESVPAGRLHVTARNGDSAGEAEVMIKQGQNTSVTVRLTQGGSVTGHLVSPDGTSTSGWVSLLTAQGEESTESITVDDSGLFEIRPVPAGAYQLMIAGEKGPKKALAVKSGEVTTLGDIVITRELKRR